MSERDLIFPVERDRRFAPATLLRDVAASGRPNRMRFPDGHRGWLVSDYENGRAVLADRRFTIGETRQPTGEPEKSSAYDDALGPLRAGAITSLDPPAQTRLRRAVGARFTPASVEERKRGIETIVREQLDEFERAGSPGDLFAGFALPVPSRVICGLLGVPESDAPQFIEPTELLLNSKATSEQVSQSFATFSDYVREVVERKRTAPEDDLLSDMLSAGVLSDDEVAGLALELFVTGHETSAGLIAMSTLVLLEERSLWERLRGEPELMDTAVEELLRYITGVEIGFTRTALEDVTIGEVTIAAGESVTVSLLGGNYDPAQFEAPERLALDREENRHLAFGHGIHKCLGQYLAKLELRVALAAMLERFPNLQLAIPAAEIELETTDFGVFRTTALPVSWESPPGSGAAG